MGADLLGGMCRYGHRGYKTGSVLLCSLLHASFTPAQDHLLLTADSPLVDVLLLATYLLGVGALIALTKGRLGYEGAPSELTD